MAEHTPGPWTVGGRRHMPTICAEWHGEDTVIAEMTSTYNSEPDDTYEEESKANALVMAAAPDLLSALEAFIDGDTDCECSDCVDEQIGKVGGGSYANRAPGRCRYCVGREALAKAKGT